MLTQFSWLFWCALNSSALRHHAQGKAHLALAIKAECMVQGVKHAAKHVAKLMCLGGSAAGCELIVIEAGAGAIEPEAGCIRVRHQRGP